MPPWLPSLYSAKYRLEAFIVEMANSGDQTVKVKLAGGEPGPVVGDRLPSTYGMAMNVERLGATIETSSTWSRFYFHNIYRKLTVDIFFKKIRLATGVQWLLK